MSSELVKQESAVQESESPATGLLRVIAQAATDPRVDIEKMERLLAMQERVMESQQKIAFAAAMSRLQAKLPMIKKTRSITVKGVERSRYAPIEDIYVTVRPFLEEEGFSLSFNEESANDKVKQFSAKLSHRDGYSETKFLTVPIDFSDFRTTIQSHGSTTSYARRYLMKMHLNLIECDEDDDGQGGLVPISDDQVLDLTTLIQDSKSNHEKFLEFMGVSKLEDILLKDYMKAANALQTKKQRSGSK